MAWAPSVAGRSSARQEAALIGPIERQIEVGKARRSELDGLPAVQDHLDQLGAQKGEVDEAPDMPSHGPTPAPLGWRFGSRVRVVWQSG